MNPSVLDNPIWHALTGPHARFAIGSPRLRRYPADVAPFFGIPEDADGTPLEPESLLAPGEVVSFIGAVPAAPAGWVVEVHMPLLQMVAGAPVAVDPAGPAVSALTAADVPDMLALTQLVFPGYFRPRTIEMGTYLGVRVDGRLAAMAGERLCLPGHREISGVCTHPDFVGRGHASHLVALLMNAVFADGELPFLHVNPANAGAIRVYERLGFTRRRELPLCQVRALA